MPLRRHFSYSQRATEELRPLGTSASFPRRYAEDLSFWNLADCSCMQRAWYGNDPSPSIHVSHH